MRSRPILAVLVLCLALPAPAPGATPKLWATVNACDTGPRPDTIGIRASMPGNGTGQRLYMRFQVQFYDAARGLYVNSGPATRFLHVGSARFRTTQAGYEFEFDAPPAGTQYTLRGLVSFEYRARRGGRLVVVKRARRVTKSGYRRVEGGDPPGTSEAVCVIRP